MRSLSSFFKTLFSVLMLLTITSLQAQEILMTSNSLKSAFEEISVEPADDEKKVDFKLPTLLETKSFYSDGQRPSETFLNTPITNSIGPGDMQIEGARTVNFFRFMNQRAQSVHSFDVNGVLQHSEFSIQIGN